MSGNGAASCELCVAVHTSHRIGHAVRRGACRHVIGVQGTSRAAARRNGEVFFAVIPAPFLVSACNGMLEAGGVGAVAGDGNVNAFVAHDSNAFVHVVCAVATNLCAFAVAVSGGFDDFKGIGVLVVIGLYVGETVYAADDESGVFSKSVQNDLQGLFTNLVCRARDTDCAFCRRETFVTCKESEAFGFVAKEHCGEVAVAETDFAVFRDRARNAERLQTDADCFGGVRGFFAVFLDCDCTAYGISPDGVVERDGLDTFYDCVAVNAFVQADFLRVFKGSDAVFFKDTHDFINTSFITFEFDHCSILLLLFAGVDVFCGGCETAVTSRTFFERFVGGNAFFDHFHHFSEVDEFVTDDFAFFVKTDAGDVAFCHFKVAYAFCLCGEHRADLASQTFSEVFEGRADNKTVVRESGLGTTVNDLQEQFAHCGVDCVAYKVGIERFENGFAGKNFGSHSRRVSHTAATDRFDKGFFDNAVFDVKGKFARALLGSAPAYAVSETADVLNFFCLNPFAFLGNGGGTVVGTFFDTAHFNNFI